MLSDIILILSLASMLALPIGYTIYRARRIALIERMGRQLYSETQGYINGRPYRLANDGTPIYGYQPSFHFGDKVEVTSGLYEGMQGKIQAPAIGDEYGVRLEDGSSTWTFAHIEKRDLRLITALPQSITSHNPLLNRPPNPDLDIIYSKSGKFVRTLPGTPILRYYPDTDTVEMAPYVKQEFEDRAGEMLQVEML